MISTCRAAGRGSSRASNTRCRPLPRSAPGRTGRRSASRSPSASPGRAKPTPPEPAAAEAATGEPARKSTKRRRAGRAERDRVTGKPAARARAAPSSGRSEPCVCRPSERKRIETSVLETFGARATVYDASALLDCSPVIWRPSRTAVAIASPIAVPPKPRNSPAASTASPTSAWSRRRRRRDLRLTGEEDEPDAHTARHLVEERVDRLLRGDRAGSASRRSPASIPRRRGRGSPSPCRSSPSR